MLTRRTSSTRCTTEAYRPCEIWRHRIGTPANDDVRVLSEPDDRFELNLRATRSGDAIIMWSESNSTSESWFLDAHEPMGTPRSIGSRRRGVRYRAEHRRLADGSADLLIVTNDGAVEFRLMTAPVPGSANQDWSTWTELIPENPNERLMRADAFSGAIVVTLRTAGTTALRILPQGHTLTSDLPAGEVSLARNPMYDVDAITSTMSRGSIPRSGPRLTWPPASEPNSCVPRRLGMTPSCI